MVNTTYIPERGDLIWLDFDPHVGHEQSGLRPALVLSPRMYHERSGIALVCPITSVPKSYSFQIPLPPLKKIHGYVLTDHLKSLDFRARGFKFIERAPRSLIKQVQEILSCLILQEE
jgi:mRNA interferase MazF